MSAESAVHTIGKARVGGCHSGRSSERYQVESGLVAREPTATVATVAALVRARLRIAVSGFTVRIADRTAVSKSVDPPGTSTKSSRSFSLATTSCTRLPTSGLARPAEIGVTSPTQWLAR